MRFDSTHKILILMKMFYVSFALRLETRHFFWLTTESCWTAICPTWHYVQVLVQLGPIAARLFPAQLWSLIQTDMNSAPLWQRVVDAVHQVATFVVFSNCQGSSGEFSTLAAVCRPIESAEFMLVLSMGWIDEFWFFQVEFWLTMLVVEVVGTTWTMPRSWQGTSAKKSAVPNGPKLNLTRSVNAKPWEFVGVFSFCCEALHFLVEVFGVRNA